ncbi:HAD family hydrolase [Sphingomonas agri]|uniref:HAD family hydrolase n=1 Tax=Sphingomonas agri TaxID=1813878 RepID=UPI00311E9F32
MTFIDAIIFDFDGVLLESEFELNRLTAELLTGLGHPTSFEEAIEHYTGLAGRHVIEKIEARIGRQLPDEFHDRMSEASRRALADGIEPIGGAVEFVRKLPPDLPRAIASSSSTRWVRTHLAHLGLSDAFEPHIYSGREHVSRGKPEPDLYLHAAECVGADIHRTVVVEDSKVGVTGALASGARVIGLAAGSHCLDGHADMLRALGVKEVASSFDQVAGMLGL